MPVDRPIQTQAFPRLLHLMQVDPAYFDLSIPEDQVPNGYRLTKADFLRQAKRVHDAFALSDGELTAQLLLAGVLEEVQQETAFTLAEVLKDPTEFESMRQWSREIRAILNSDRAVEDRVAFSEVLEDALKHYGVQDNEEVRKLIDNDFALGELRFNALNAVHNLRLTQFLQGEVGDGPRPRYNTVVRRWWSLDHMLAAQTTLPEGVSLNVVTAGSSHDLFFCYAVRRGGNLYLMHDAPEYSHPLESQRSRRPDRALAARINKFYFPYELANVYMSSNGREADPVEAMAGQRVTALEILGKKDGLSRVVGTIADLPAVEMIWNAMMFDLIMDKFWSPAPLPALPLSYTAGQLKTEGQLLLETAQAAGLPVVASASAVVSVPDLTVSDVADLHLADNAKQALGATSSSQMFRWMEERYGHLVTDDAVNPVADGKLLPRLTHQGQFEMVSVQEHGRETSIFDREKAPTQLEALALDAFGTAEELKADRGFLARHNYARALSKFAKLEHKEVHEEMRQWVNNAYQERKEFLLSLVPAAHAKELIILDWNAADPQLEGIEIHPVLGTRFTTEAPRGGRGSHRSVRHLLGEVKETGDTATMSFYNAYLAYGNESRSNWKPSCLVTGAVVTYYAQFVPSNSLELAWLLGKDVEELPEILRNYNRLDMRLGNSILNRVDPMAADIHNPWDQTVFGVRFGLSKRGLAQLLKTPGPTPDLSSLQHGNARVFTGEVRFPVRAWTPSSPEPEPTSLRRRGPGIR